MAFCRVGRCLRLGKRRKLRRFSIDPLHQSQICETTLPRNLGRPTQLNALLFTAQPEPLTGRRDYLPVPLAQGSPGLGGDGRDLVKASPLCLTKFELLLRCIINLTTSRIMLEKNQLTK